MRTSVALCTYNGEKFLEAQINSILSQTTSVDEIIICDDGSSDSTYDIALKYQQKFPNLIHVYRNKENLRSVKNFEKAIQLCTKDLIFLSDQDDIWLPEKVQKILSVFQQNPEISVVATNGYGINQEGERLNVFTIWDVPRLVSESGFVFDYFKTLTLIGNFCTGATMCIKKDFIPEIIPFPVYEGYHHDEWIGTIAASQGKLYFLDEKLIEYRQHTSQQVGGVFYSNTVKERKSLLTYFSIEKQDKSFTQYKRFLKRLIGAHKKYTDLVKTNSQLHFSGKHLATITNLIAKTKTEMIQKYPFRSNVQFYLDKLTGKRKFPY